MIEEKRGTEALVNVEMMRCKCTRCWACENSGSPSLSSGVVPLFCAEPRGCCSLVVLNGILEQVAFSHALMQPVHELLSRVRCQSRDD